MLCPNLEGWLIKVCKDMNVDLKKFFLPVDESQLHKEINSHLPKIKDLIEHLKSINAAPLIYLESEIN